MQNVCRDIYMFAPYVDTTLWPILNIADINLINSFTLGFVVAGENNEPSWGGVYPVASDFYSDIIHKTKGPLICSFGGAEGSELALKIESTEKLYAAYDDVVEKYRFKFLDFDIEGGAVADIAANKRRAQAIKKLQKKHPNLHISLTVPVMPHGLDNDVLQLIKTTPHQLVNLMTMDFGNQKNMFEAVASAARSAREQIKEDIGITVMIGKNDTPEIFSLEDAKHLAEYVKRNKSWIKRLSFWSMHRDQGRDGPLSHSSKIDQTKWEFTSIFKSVY